MKNHELIFSEDQKIVFEKLKHLTKVFEKKKFILFGGTALALQIAHRRSYDFDFMTQQKFDPKTLASELRKEMPNLHTIRTKKNTLDCQWKSAKLSFFGGVSRPALFPCVQYQHLSLLSIPDIIAMKVSAMLERNVMRDYFDIATILQFEGIGMEDIIEWFYKKYGKEARQFYPSWIVKCLTHLDDIDYKKQHIVRHADFWTGNQKTMIDEILKRKAKKYLEGK